MTYKATTTTYSWPPGPTPSSTYGVIYGSQKEFDLHGLSWQDAQYAICNAAMERNAAIRRGQEQCASHKARLSRRGR